MRRFGEAPQAGKIYTRRAGAYAVLPRMGRLLLTAKTGAPPDLQLPGGGIDAGESPIAALHREVAEETGWRIARPRRIGAFRRFVYMPEYDLWAEKICLVFVAHPVRRSGPPSEPGHHAIWMTPALAARHLGNAADRHFAGRFIAR